MKKHPVLLFLLLPLLLFGQKKNIDKNLLAVNGYDLVSYFTKENPQKGNAAYKLSWQGAHYLFVSEEHKAIFKKNPKMYLPAYGGWCAYAMAKGKEVEINPKAYYIQQGQLLLFYKTSWVDTQAKWIKDKLNLKAKADKVWAKKLVQNN
ncbi:MAG: YHS domain-containing (seleno)protein [Flavobacteriaceae bacterium]